jgi:hypothetical protein
MLQQVEVYRYAAIHTRLGTMTVVNEVDAEEKVAAQWFPVRAHCELLELEPERQKKIVREDYLDALREIPIQLPIGWRRVLCIRRKEMALWLGGIDPKRCKLGAREALEEYRVELAAAADQLLWKHISLGSAVMTRTLAETTAVYVHAQAEGSCLACGAQQRVTIHDGVATWELLGEEE